MRIYLTVLILLGLIGNSALKSQPYVVDQIVGIVGNNMIKLSDVEDQYMQMKAQGYPVDDSTRCKIFEKMLESKLLENQAQVDSIEVSDEMVESELNQRLNYFINQIGSVEKLEKYFNKSLSEIKSDLRQTLREQELAQKMQGSILEDVEVTPSEVKEYYNTLPKDSIPRIPKQVELAQIAIYPRFSEKAVTDVKARLLEMRKRILNGEPFAALATLYSEDDGSAAHGGEIGFLTKAELDPAYAKAAFALVKPGDVSHIVETQFGYHIIQLIARRGDRVDTRHILLKPKPDPEAVKGATHFLDSIANLIRNDSISFDKAVAYYSMDQDTRFNYGLLVNPNTGGNRFEMEQIAPADYYAIKNLKVGEISDPYQARDSKGRVYYKIIRIKSEAPAHLANLNLDYTRIQNMALAYKKKQVMKKWFADKIKTTFIHIDRSFASCHFTLKDWLKYSN